MYMYKVDLGTKNIDLDSMMDILTGEGCDKGYGDSLRQELYYAFGQAGYKFIVDTLQEQVDNIKARQPSAE